MPKIGKVLVSRWFIENSLDNDFRMLYLFKKMITVLKEVENKETDMFEFTCLCDEFDDIKEGEEIPYYKFSFSINNIGAWFLKETIKVKSREE